jgi:diguanylate cyclase (GGDEF)-like protein
VIALRDITERKRAERENARLYEQSLIEIKERKQAQENLDRVNKALAQQLAENKLLQAQLLEQAVRDPITGVFNRRYLDETLEREIFRATREQTFVSIVMLDIDHFKQFNDTYGHAAGDLMLKKLGEMLTRKTRKGDIACRYGGEEFAVIMPGAALETALQRAEIWRAEIEALTVAFETHTLRGTISLGVACFPQHGSNGREVLICADRAMYSAKQNGRNKVCMYQAGT